MQQLSTLWLVGVPLAILSSCQGVRVNAEAETALGTGRATVEVPPGGGGAGNPTTITVYPDPVMYGLCAYATVTGPNGPIAGPPTPIGPGPNFVQVPAGMGPPAVSLARRQEQLPSTPLRDVAASIESYYYAAIPWAPVPGENTYSFLEIEATSRAQADLGYEVLNGMYRALLDGTDPGPVPWYTRVASYTSWHRVESGPHTGDIVFTNAKPGTLVEEFRLEFNDFVATLGNGATRWTLGAWQVVAATVPAEDVQLPTPSGAASNAYRIVFDTDIGNALPNSAELSIELVP